MKKNTRFNYDSRLRPMLVKDIIYDSTDNNHWITSNEILNILEDIYGLKVTRQTLYTDIEKLIDAGYDIVTERDIQNKYRVASRDFDIAELKMIIDNIEASKSLSYSRSLSLAKKIAAEMIDCGVEELNNHEQFGFVQFHPSYDYTDFVEGLRPNDNVNGFKRKDGIFKAFCAKAAISEKNDKDADNKGKRYRAPKEKTKLSYNEQKEYDSIEEEIEKLELRSGELEELIVKAATDYTRLTELTLEKESVDAEIEQKMDRFIELQDMVDSFNSNK